MITEIDLTNCEYVFQDPVFTGLKKTTYIYGKNGTGKSSLVNAIKAQYGQEYNVCIFNGFEKFIKSNPTLDAIALGNDNKQVAEKIEGIDRNINQITETISPQDNPNEQAPNLYGEKRTLELTIATQKKELDVFLRDSASKMKHAHSDITGVNYNKNDFFSDIANAADMSKEQSIDFESTMKSVTLNLSDNDLPILPIVTSIAKLTASVNDILARAVKPSTIIPELMNDPDKQAFAQRGMEIHVRKEGERCAFCGNILSDDRWQMLDDFFSTATDELKSRIGKGKALLLAEIQKLQSSITIDESKWQPKYWAQATKIVDESNKQRESIILYLTALSQQLAAKENKLFQPLNPIQIDQPESLATLQKELDELWRDNTIFNTNLRQEKSIARNSLREKMVWDKLQLFDYAQKAETMHEQEVLLQSKDADIQSKRAQIEKLQKQRTEEMENARNESKAAIAINKLIGSLGDDSFTLQHIAPNNEQKGLYQILDRTGKERSIDTQSTGEKNIVSFLWFIYHLQDVENSDHREKIIIFDDPVNSNDDSSQYLIISEIHQIVQSIPAKQVIVLTHSNFFYLQVRPAKPQYNKNSQAYFRLQRQSKTIIIPINSSSEDITTIYQELWNELYFSYVHDKISFMWNDMRRILESFGKFNYANNSPADTDHQIESVEDKVLFYALLKSLNVNSHIGTDPGIDLSNRNKEQLLDAFRNVFTVLGVPNHYQTYWPNNQ